MADRPVLQIVDNPLGRPAARPAAPDTDRGGRGEAERTPTQESGHEAAGRADEAAAAKAPRRKPRTPAAPVTAPPLTEAQADVFARVPLSLGRRLSASTGQLRERRKDVGQTPPAQQEIIAALLWEFVDDTDQGKLEALDRLHARYAAARYAASAKALNGESDAGH